MRKLIESTFVTLGEDISAPREWSPSCLFGPGQDDYSRELLSAPARCRHRGRAN